MLAELIKYVSEELDKRSIEYMLSGSFAMLLYTTPRMTRDVDMVIVLKEEQIDSFLEIFEKDFYYHRPSITEEVRRKGMFNIIDHKSGYKIDFVLRKDTEYRFIEFSRKIRTDTFGFETWVVSAEDLLLSKLIWIQPYQSKQQTEDIENLWQYPDLDKVYVLKWCSLLNLNTFNILKDE